LYSPHHSKAFHAEAGSLVQMGEIHKRGAAL
jgi:hypothetical protein